MIHNKIAWVELSFDELINLVVEAQKELEKRGTITKCRTVFSKGRVKPEFLTGYVKDRK